jgi:hypothetical protein
MTDVVRHIPWRRGVAAAGWVGFVPVPCRLSALRVMSHAQHSPSLRLHHQYGNETAAGVMGIRVESLNITKPQYYHLPGITGGMTVWTIEASSASYS